MKYSYIGNFELTSGQLLVVDPATTSLYGMANTDINNSTLNITNCIGGLYNAYHVFNELGELVELIIVHSAHTIEHAMCARNLELLGSVNTTLSNKLAIVDQMFAFDSQYCYYPVEYEAFYDVDFLLGNIKNLTKETIVEDALYQMFSEKKESHCHPQGKDIMLLLGATPVWEGLKAMGELSTHWYEDIKKSLEHSYKPAITIKAGVASLADNGLLDCYSITNEDRRTYAIKIMLNSK